jgi:transposase-like protein
MRGKKQTPEAVVKSLRDVERLHGQGKSIAEACKELGISVQTFYGWRSQYGSMSVAEVRELRRLRDENARLKRMVADKELELELLKEVSRGNF